MTAQIELPLMGEMYNLIVDELQADSSNKANMHELCGTFKAMSRPEMYEWYLVYLEQRNKRTTRKRQPKRNSPYTTI